MSFHREFMPLYANQSQDQDDLIVGFPSNKCWLALLVLVDIVAFVGNSLMICGVLSTKRFHAPSHYLLVSLSVSDFLTSVLVMPLGILNAVTGEWHAGERLCHFWLVVDVTCCSASVLNLALISLDRYWCILKPLRYANIQTTKFCFFLIGLVWSVAIFTACVPLLGWMGRQGHTEINVCVISWFFPSHYLVFIVILNLLAPFLVMLYVYARIYATARRQLHRIAILFVQQNQAGNAVSLMTQNKASRRLGMLLGVFLVCWSPYLLVTLYLQFCSLCRIHPFVVDIVTWLAWANSCFNPILYSWLNREYRIMYKNMLKCRSLRRNGFLNSSRSEAKPRTVTGLRIH